MVKHRKAALASVRRFERQRRQIGLKAAFLGWAQAVCCPPMAEAAWSYFDGALATCCFGYAFATWTCLRLSGCLREEIRRC